MGTHNDNDIAQAIKQVLYEMVSDYENIDGGVTSFINRFTSEIKLDEDI